MKIYPYLYIYGFMTKELLIGVKSEVFDLRTMIGGSYKYLL